MARSSGSRSLPLTSTSNEKARDCGSIPAISPMRTPTLTARAGLRASVSLRTASRIPLAMPTSCISADPRQLVAGQHVDDAGGAEGRVHGDESRMALDHFSDDRGLRAERMPAHGGEYRFGRRRRDDGDQLPLVGYIKRVQAQNFAGPAHAVVYGEGGFADGDAGMRLHRDLIERAGQTAARGIAHGADIAGRGQDRSHQCVERRGVALDGAFEFEAPALGEDGDAVVAERSAEDHSVAGAGVGGRNIDPGGDHAEARRVDEDAVSAAPLDYFGVAGDDGHADILRGTRHGIDHAADAPESKRE